MSTRFTSRGVPLVESQSLKLIQGAATLNDVITKHLSQRLIDKGYVSITPALLSFLSILECGVNYGSEIARNLNVTRQMVAKTVKVLCQLEYLQQKDGAGKQKEIHFTEKGEYLMSDARQLLAEMDDILFKNTSTHGSQSIIDEINTMIDSVKKQQN